VIVYTADWVVPVTAAPIRHGAVAVTPDGRLGYVGPAAHAPDGQRRALGRSLLLPGLVNVHTHLELTAMRGLLENLAFYDWILTLTRARRQVLDRDDLFASSVAGIVEGLGAGITTYADTSASGVVADAMCAMGVRGVMYLEIFGPDPAELENALREYLPRLEAARAAETSLVRVGISPHAPYSVSTTLLRAMAELAWREGLPAAIHVAESREEMAFVRDAAGPWARSHANR
jgi:cytosine/adenosine deaminase-related metal-dependent hydrolase